MRTSETHDLICVFFDFLSVHSAVFEDLEHRIHRMKTQKKDLFQATSANSFFNREHTE